MSGAVFQFACWTYLPDFATRQVLSVIHRLSERAFAIPPPPPRSPVYVRHYRYIYTAVVLCYLTYNFMDASSGLPMNFYELLGVGPRSDEGALRAAFRAFARKNHPDRIGPKGEALFIEVRDAFEALKDPVVRFAYDRFGPDVLRWRDCTTMKDYLRRGLLNSLPRHIMTGIALFLFSVVGKQSPIAAWRYLLFVGMFALELYLMVAPSSRLSGASAFVDQVPSQWMLFESLFPQRVAYQHILLLHQVFLFMSVAISRVAPVLFAGMLQVEGEMEAGAVRAMGGRIGELAKGVEKEIWLMLNTEVHAVHDTPGEMASADEFRMEVLMREMEDMVVENKLKSEVGPMRSAWDKAVESRVRARSMSL
ncbi:DnaJ-domain-containing protein [Boletus edulis]|nr:DnaJ-domain-containing protein [Boletus edulis]